MNELSLEAVVLRLNVALSDDDADSVLAELRAAANERGIDAASIASDTASLVDVLRIVAELGIQLRAAPAHA